MNSFDTIFRRGTIVNHHGVHETDIGVENGRITALGNLSRAASKNVIDCKGLHILPGVIDTQVHFREPGLTHKEDLESGSRGAVLGGVTGVFEMPNTNPLTTTRETFEEKIAAATNRMHCDFAFYVGGTHENVSELPFLEKLPGCAGV
ncbi:MAG: dihydroorotase, partial [Pseudomonadota bacterium]